MGSLPNTFSEQTLSLQLTGRDSVAIQLYDRRDIGPGRCQVVRNADQPSQLTVLFSGTGHDRAISLIGSLQQWCPTRLVSCRCVSACSCQFTVFKTNVYCKPWVVTTFQSKRDCVCVSLTTVHSCLPPTSKGAHVGRQSWRCGGGTDARRMPIFARCSGQRWGVRTGFPHVANHLLHHFTSFHKHQSV